MHYDGALASPFVEAPPPGGIVSAAPGISWLRLPVPLRLDHVNVYLIEDGEGVAVVDTGMGTQETRRIWGETIATWLRGRPITRVIVTHYHPDHIGCAGWLAERVDAPLLMSEIEYLMAVTRLMGRFNLTRDHEHAFYRKRGLESETIDGFLGRGALYLETVTPIPPSFTRLRAGDDLTIGGRRFQILSGGGHSDDQIMLYCAEDKVFLAADQVMMGITPNIGVWPSEPDGRALDLFLGSLSEIKANIPSDVLVLAGHKLPFFGLHERIDELMAHHARICARVVEICKPRPMMISEMIPKLFDRKLNPHHTVLAFAETLAHVNHLVSRALLRSEVDGQGQVRLEVA